LLHLNFAAIFIAFLVLLFSLTVHESAHAWASWRLGDPTGRLLGRVSLNPLVHIDPIGTVLFPLLAMVTHLPIIGWAKPVPVDTSKLTDERRDFLLIAAAGPVSNLALAIVGALGYRIATLIPSGSGLDMSGVLAVASMEMLQINLLLGIFNLIPVPPLDGGNVLAGLLPERLAVAYDSLRPYGFIILYALVLTGAFMRLVGPPYHLLLSWLL
jgi:Zn-dependent protease